LPSAGALAAQLGDALLAEKALELEPDLFFSEIKASCRSADIPNGLHGISAVVVRYLSHRFPFRTHDGPETRS